MASIIATMSHTKHVNIRYKYVNYYVEDRFVKSFFKSAENDSDTLTKTLIDEKLEDISSFGNI